jgi:hypothetical protein
MVDGLLKELEDYNCWSIAEAAGHRGPYRLQHLLSRAVWDDQQVLNAAAAWAVAQLDDGDAVLVVDETADEKSSADAVGAARSSGSSRTSGHTAANTTARPASWRASPPGTRSAASASSRPPCWRSS